MIKRGNVGRWNEYKQFREDSNSKDFDGEPIICPPVDSHIDISSILSYSKYERHLVWITKNKQAYAIEFNIYNKISSTMPTGKLDKTTYNQNLDKNSQQCSFLSAVCGTYCTLYLISPSTNIKTPRLAFVFQGYDNEKPLFLNTCDFYPIAIYGGRLTVATI